jgi:hypothetical protein
MLVLVWIRTKITATTPPYTNYELLKKPFFPGFEYLGGGLWEIGNFLTTSQRQEAFFNYDNYTNGTGTYSVSEDINGPLYFMPNNCLNKSSVVVPHVPSLVIAVVGPPNPVQDAVTSYLAELFELQKAASPIPA